MTDWAALLAGDHYSDIAAALIADNSFAALAMSQDPHGVISTLLPVVLQDQLQHGCGGGGYYQPLPPTIHLHPSIARRNNFTLIHEFGHHVQQQHEDLSYLLLDASPHKRKLAEEAISDSLASQILMPWSDAPLDSRFVHPAQVMAGLHASSSASRAAVVTRVQELLPEAAKWILAVATLKGEVQHARSTYSDVQPAKGTVQDGFASLAEEADAGHVRRRFHEGIRYRNGSELQGLMAEATLDESGLYVFVALTPESRFGTGSVIWPTYECANSACRHSFEGKAVKRNCSECGDPACPDCNRCSCDPTRTGRVCPDCFMQWTPGELAANHHDCY